MRLKAQPGFWLERGDLNQKKNFFARKLSHLGPMINRSMQLKRITEGGRDSSHYVIFVILRQNNDFNPISIAFHTFLKPYE